MWKQKESEFNNLARITDKYIHTDNNQNDKATDYWQNNKSETY